MRQSLARYSSPVSFVHAPSLAHFITTIVGFKVFDTHKGLFLLNGRPRLPILAIPLPSRAECYAIPDHLFVSLTSRNAPRSRRIPRVFQLSELPWMTSLDLAVVRAIRCQVSRTPISILRAPTAECVRSDAEYLPRFPDVYPGS